MDPETYSGGSYDRIIVKSNLPNSTYNNCYKKGLQIWANITTGDEVLGPHLVLRGDSPGQQNKAHAVPEGKKQVAYGRAVTHNAFNYQVKRPAIYSHTFHVGEYLIS